MLTCVIFEKEKVMKYLLRD